MNSKPLKLEVKSHVARDLLQSASLFKTDKLVVWEYVSNGLQYVEPGVAPIVRVTLEPRKKRIEIQDNGRGMDGDGLQNFFIMHGENQDRRAGHSGRGRFGTGKSAAFGIAENLRVTTVRDGRRSVVELLRGEIAVMTSHENIPVHVRESGVLTPAPNGTTIEIENIHLRSLDQKGIIAYIERHLARWPKNARVFVNNQECEFCEPPISDERKIKPDAAAAGVLGDVELTLKTARAPLDEELRGVAIYANSVWLETTLAGSENRDMAQYIFGEIDVPRLDEDTSPIAPFDMSRSMRLNPNNALVQAIYAFINQHIEAVRRELVEAERQRKAGEEAKKLDRHADEIARVINEDFNDYRQRVAQVKARLNNGKLDWQSGAGENANDLLSGGEISANIVAPEGAPGSWGEGGKSEEEKNARLLNPLVELGDENANHTARPAGGEEEADENKKSKPKLRGGFGIKFGHLGEDEARAKYARDERTIFINLEHPQFAAAQSLGSIEDVSFRRLAYEVAFAEYAIALSVEKSAQGEFLEPGEVFYDIRETLNRVARKGAALYSK
jgi:hypothetical protein